MTIPYAFTRVMEGKEPFLDKNSRSPKEQAQFLLKSGHMKGKYLGACLDSSRWGSATDVMYEMPVTGLIHFVQNWMRQNKKNFTKLWHERKIEDLYKKFELPFVDNKKCTVEKHAGTVMDHAGNLRCAYTTKKLLKPSFMYSYVEERNKHGVPTKIEFDERDPTYNLPSEEYNDTEIPVSLLKENEAMLKEQKEFEEEIPSVEVSDTCYAIISESKNKLSLETILKRLNLNRSTITERCGIAGPCMRLDEVPEGDRQFYDDLICIGHERPNNQTVFPFDGWDLALYVQKWYEQKPGDSPWFEK